MPPEPKLGIVTGGPDVFFRELDYINSSAEILREHAKRKGYAFHIDNDMERFSGRAGPWNKIVLIHQLLRTVPMLVWFDAGVKVHKLDKSLEVLIKQATCDEIGQDQYKKYLPKESTSSTSIWLHGDVRPKGKEQYPVNVNTQIMAFRRTPIAFQFLESVWHQGDEPKLYTKFQSAARGQKDGWPFEQGGVWQAIFHEPARFLPSTCVIPSTGLQYNIKVDLDRPNLSKEKKRDRMAVNLVKKTPGYLKKPVRTVLKAARLLKSEDDSRTWIEKLREGETPEEGEAPISPEIVGEREGAARATRYMEDEIPPPGAQGGPRTKGQREHAMYLKRYLRRARENEESASHEAEHHHRRAEDSAQAAAEQPV